jgi:hypothetical protein
MISKECLDIIDGVITTAATVVIAFFTIVLARVTGRQAKLTRELAVSTAVAAEAAKKSADVAEQSLTDLEGPFLYPLIETEDVQASIQALRVYVHTYPDNPDNPIHPVISFKFRNYGRSPALLQSISAVFFYGQPNDVHHDQLAGFASEMLIDAGAMSETSTARRLLEGIGKNEYQSIMAGVGKVLLRGSIIFFDIFGNRYEQKFCLAWKPDMNKFMAWGTETNRRRRLSS